jgi:hypothetical protein
MFLRNVPLFSQNTRCYTPGDRTLYNHWENLQSYEILSKLKPHNHTNYMELFNRCWNSFRKLSAAGRSGKLPLLLAIKAILALCSRGNHYHIFVFQDCDSCSFAASPSKWQYPVIIPAKLVLPPETSILYSFASSHSLIVTEIQLMLCFIYHFSFYANTKKNSMVWVLERTKATADCRRSDCQLLRVEGATWSAWRIPTAIFSVF